MSSTSDNVKAPGQTQVTGMALFSLGLYGMVLGWTVPLALLSWPGAMGNDASGGLLLLALFLFVGGSLLVLVSLLSLKVHWLLFIGVLVLALLAPFLQGKLFPTNPAFWARNWFLTFGGVVALLSFILIGRVKGVWPALWRTLLVTGASAAIIVAVAIASAVVAAQGPGSTNGVPPPSSPVFPLAGFLLGGADLFLVVYWLSRMGRESGLST